MARRLVQDIHSSDASLWQTFQQYWEQHNYVAALSLLSHGQLPTKYVNAGWFNNLTNFIVQLENNDDPDFKDDAIKASYIPPSLDTGEVFFQLIDPQVRGEIEIGIIPVGSNTTTVHFSYDTFVNALAFDDLELCQVDISVTSNNVTFTTAENVTRSIICLVFAVPSGMVYVEQTTLTSAQTYAGIYCDTYGEPCQLVSCYVQDTTTNQLVTCTEVIVFPNIEFRLEQPPTNTLLCTVIYAREADNVEQVRSGELTSSVSKITLDCYGYLTGLIATYNHLDRAWTDISLNSTKAYISKGQNLNYANDRVNCEIHTT